MKGKFPLVVIFIDIPFDQVDVNVHPSKREIKFFNGQRVYQAVSETIGTALSREQQNIMAYSKTQVEKFEYSDEAFKPDQMDKIEQSSMDWPTDLVKNKENLTDRQAVQNFSPNVTSNNLTFKAQHPKSRVIGQILGTYILAESQDGLMLFDQHAAHERIVYEKLKRRYHSLKVQSQTLAVPETLHLNFKEADLLFKILDDLKALGMIIEPFGDTTFVVKAVPALIDEKEIKPIILEILETALIKKNTFSKEDWLENCLILMACHGAIRANLTLDRREMETLLSDLDHCENPRHCPHGRPIMISWTKHQIEKLFKRVL